MAGSPAAPLLADAHCHLQLSPLGGCVERTLRRAREKGVGALMVCATHPDEFDAVERMAGLHDTGSGSIMVLVSLGVHPFRAADVSAPPPSGAEAEAAWVADVRNRIERSGRRIGIGECGLDRSPSGLARCPMDVQLAVFEAQVALAAELGLPLTVHCVRAVAHVATALRRHAPLRAPVVLHSWAGKPGALGELTALGCVPSFSGAVCNPAFKAARSSAAACAQDALLAETDSPDQLPVCMRDSRCGGGGRGAGEGLVGAATAASVRAAGSAAATPRAPPPAAATSGGGAQGPCCSGASAARSSGSANEPCNVSVVAEHLAAIRGERPAALAARLSRNFVATFGALDKDGHLERALGTRGAPTESKAKLATGADAESAEP